MRRRENGSKSLSIYLCLEESMPTDCTLRLSQTAVDKVPVELNGCCEILCMEWGDP